MQKVEDVKDHGNIPGSKEVDGVVKEQNRESDETTDKLTEYLRKPLLPGKRRDIQMTESERIRWEMQRKIYTVDALAV